MLSGVAAATEWNDNAFRNTVDKAERGKGRGFVDCNDHGVHLWNSGAGGLILAPDYTDDPECKHKDSKHYPYKPFIPGPAKDFIDRVFVGKFDCRQRGMFSKQVTQDDYEWVKDNVRPGDMVFTFPPGWFPGHLYIVIDTEFGDEVELIVIGNNPFEYEGLLFHSYRDVIEQPHYIQIVSRPENDMLAGCRDVKEKFTMDSTFKRHVQGKSGEPGWGWNAHREVCCWKGHARHSWPWTDNPSGYACLSWEHNARKTWDTMVSPRIDLRGCTDAKLHQMSLSTLTKGTRRVLGSTDDGETWPYVIGNDQLQTADLPWADNKQKVRLAWAYSGPVKLGEYWALDEIWVMARPSRNHDIWVTEARPRGIVGHGTRLQPWVRVFNRGEKADTFNVTLRIGSYLYNQTRQVSLNPYSDTSLRFTPDWTATPGTHTVVAYASSANDEFRGNDTVVMTVRVVADTWVQRYGLGNTVGRSAALCRVSDDTLYFLRGYANPAKDFLIYKVGADLWARRRAAPASIT